MSPHMAVAVVLIAIALGVIAGVTAYELRAGKDVWREFERWERSRDVTGRVVNPKRWE